MKASPYDGMKQSEWRTKTCELVQRHPLQEEVIVSTLSKSWAQFWTTKVGGTIDLADPAIDIPAQIISHFLEKLFAFNIAKTDAIWRGGTRKTEKDLVYTEDDTFSFEMKCSSDANLQVYGNRSYTHGHALKNKTGYFLTVNFSGTRLSLIRFGWVDYDDWISQKSSSGQQARLYPYVYKHKLKVLSGAYMQRAPVTVLLGVGKGTAQTLQGQGVTTLLDIDHMKEGKQKTKYMEKRIHFFSATFRFPKRRRRSNGG